MKKLSRSIALLSALLIAAPVVAQDTTQESTATDAPAAAEQLSEQALELGTVYQAATHGDWVIECVSTATPANDPCEMTQILRDVGENNVAKIAVTTLTGAQDNSPPAGMRITAPLMTLLPSGIGFSIDGGPTTTLAFFACNQNGCITELGLSSDDIAVFKAGAVGKVQLRPAAAPDQLVEADLSLSGFTAAFDALTGQ